MKERPILFSAPMVQAILAGRKTMTRRVVKPQPSDFIVPGKRTYPKKYDVWLGEEGQEWKCPYGQLDDRLWVREGWRIGAWHVDGSVAIDYKADNFSRREWIEVQDDDAFTRLRVQSIEDAQFKLGHKENYKWKPGESPCRWRSSIHMRREFSRITLEITGIRVERLQDMKDEDAIREGIYWSNAFDGYVTDDEGRNFHGAFATHSFMSLWQSINGAESLGANPWVWVVEFKRVDALSHGETKLNSDQCL